MTTCAHLGLIPALDADRPPGGLQIGTHVRYDGGKLHGRWTTQTTAVHKAPGDVDDPGAEVDERATTVR